MPKIKIKITKDDYQRTRLTIVYEKAIEPNQAAFQSFLSSKTMVLMRQSVALALLRQ